ncbi:MAG: branched-chain amino acid ABC transporter permease [Burkholderiales bacterium]|jgi:branched-chain amino acid transport system permease protein|nr:branched-chain amino acid ABC transporter permease [Burkholderiales bacterium]
MRAERRGTSIAPWVLLAAGVALPWVLQALGQSYYIGFARRVMIFALAAASLNLVVGQAGRVALGHAAFVGTGAYVVGILAAEGVTDAWIAWPLAVVVAGGFAALVGAVALRTRGVYFLMVTLAFAQMAYYVAISLRAYGSEDGLALAARSTFGTATGLLDDDVGFYGVVLALLAVTLWGIDRVVRSRFGAVLVGIRENPARMEALGFATRRFEWIAFVLSGALAGLAGALLVNHNRFVSPATLHWTQSAMLLIMVIVGGVGGRWGGPAGALLLLALQEVFNAWTEYWRVPLGLAMLAVVLFAPRGLAALARRRREAV